MLPEETNGITPEPVPQAIEDRTLSDLAPERVPFWGYIDLALWVGLMVGFLFVSVLLMSGLAIPFPNLRSDQTPLVLPFQLLFYAAVFFSFKVIFKLRYGKPVFSSLGWQKSPVNLLWMGAGGVALAFGISILGTLLKTPKIPLPFEKLTDTPLKLTFFAVVAVVFAPLFEELFFRGFLQPLLSRSFGVLAGMISTAILFGALHGPEYSGVWQYAAFISLVGVVLGWIRARTNSVIPSTVMHGFFNAVSVVALAFGKDI